MNFNPFIDSVSNKSLQKTAIFCIILDYIKLWKNSSIPIKALTTSFYHHRSQIVFYRFKLIFYRFKFVIVISQVRESAYLLEKLLLQG